MHIYKITFDVEHFPLLVPVKEGDFDSDALWINGALKAELWKAPLMRYAMPSKNGVRADITQITPGFFAFSEKAIDALHGLLKTHGELLELVVEGKTLVAFNPNNEIDCFDVNASTWNRRRNGERGRLIKPAFKIKKLTNIDIFQVPEHITNAFYVTDTFKRVYEKSNLSGLLFTTCLSV